MKWLDLSRYGIQVGFADLNGQCKPTIAGEESAIAACRDALEGLGFREGPEGRLQVEWSEWPDASRWEAAFPMHKKRPLADIVEHVVLDESSAMGLIGRNAITQQEYEAGFARQEATKQQASAEQGPAEQGPAARQPQDAPRDSGNTRQVNWPDFSAYGLTATFVVDRERAERPYVNIQGAEAVKRLFRNELEAIGIEATELNGQLSLRIPPGVRMKIPQIQEVLPLTRGVPTALDDVSQQEVPEVPERFDAAAQVGWAAFRSELADMLEAGRETRFQLDELRQTLAASAGLDEKLIRHEFGLGDRSILEHAETTLVEHFRSHLTADMTPGQRIDLGRQLDQMMPRSQSKTAQSVNLQQFSTPLAISAALQSALHLNEAGSIWEPTIGNGSLVALASDPARVHGLEIDPARIDRVHAQGYLNVTAGDAIHSPVGDANMDRVIVNPPFGRFPDGMGRRDFQTDVPKPDGSGPVNLSVPSQDQFIALRHLEQMDKNGFAGVILGADNPAQFKAGEYSEATEAYLNFLLDNYNVIDIRYVEGNLYGSHGAGWPLLMVVTGGKRDMVQENEIPTTLEVISSVDDLKEFADGVGELVRERLDELAEQGPAARQAQEDADVERKDGTPERGEADALEGGDGLAGSEPSESLEQDEAQPSAQGEEEGGAWIEAEEQDNDSNQRHALEEDDKVAVYRSRSRMNTLNKRVPSNLAAPITGALERVEAANGDIDAWVAEEMGWTLAELEDRLAAEQVDAVALSMFQAQNGKGFILGDNTGVGKGRVVATLYAWGIKQGKKPIFCTSKEGLFFDIMRDFHDIGEGGLLKPLVLNDTKDMKDPETGQKLLEKTPRSVVQKALKGNSIPEGYNGVFMTYSQVNRPLHKSRKANWLINVAEDNVLLFDEVHNASGPDSNTGANIGAAIRQGSFTLGASGTYAKRPDNLGVYHFTSMFAGGDPDTVIEAVSKGGPEYQEVLSTMLAASGQLIVRSHRPAPAPEAKIVNPNYAEGYNAREFVDRLARVIDAMTAVADRGEEIVNAENEEIKQFIKNLPEDVKGQYDGWKAQSLNFGSQAYNIVKVAMYAAKADALVDEVEAEIKEGRRPTVALEGTMETFLREAHAKEFNTRMEKLLAEQEEGAPAPVVGDIRMNLTYRDTLLKYLDRMVIIKQTDRYGNETERPMIPDLERFKEAHSEDRLSQAIQEAQAKEDISQDDAVMLGYYFTVADIISELPSSLPASPLDYVQSKLRQRGIECAEMTGRSLALHYDTDDGVPEFRHRTDAERDRVAAANGFNNGDVQAIFFNGATAEGVSLNPSLKFKNQEPRTMLFWQVIGDVSAFNQQAGRIDRSGQDENVKPKYKIIALDTPSEKRVMANLDKKDGSLKANTRADRDTGIGTHGVPMMNRVGDLVTFEVLNKHPKGQEITGKLKINLDDELDKFSETGMKTGMGSETGINSRLTGRLSRMQLAESEPLMEELEEAYKDRVAWLDQQGTNPLRTQIHDFRGSIVREHEIFPRSGPSEFEGDVRALEMDYIDYINPIPFDKVEKQINRSHEILKDANLDTCPLQTLWPRVDQSMKQRIWENGVHHARQFVESLDGPEKTDALIEAIRRRPNSISRDEDVVERLERLVNRFDLFAKLRDQLAVGAEIRGFPAMNAVFDCEVESANMVVTRIIPPKADTDPCLGGRWAIRLASPDPDVGQFDLSLNQVMEHLKNTPQMKISNEPLTLDEVHQRFSDDRVPRSVSCKRFALVGQLFTAYDITNNADNLSRGKPGVFTTDDGKKLRGIIMPRSFDVASMGYLLNSNFNMSHREVVQAYIERIVDESRHPVIYTTAAHQNQVWANAKDKPFSAGTGAVILKDADTGSWKLRVSSVKRTGGKYQQDEALKDLLDTDFATSGNASKLMEATFSPARMSDIVDHLMTEHGQVFHGDKEHASWYRDHMRERGKRLIEEQNAREAELRTQKEEQRASDLKVEAQGAAPARDTLELDY